jgi:hypothetical protein
MERIQSGLGDYRSEPTETNRINSTTFTSAVEQQTEQNQIDYKKAEN